MLEEAKALKITGVGYLIPCLECRVQLTAVSMKTKYRRMNGKELAIDWNQLPVSQTEQNPQFCDVIFLWTKQRCPCPFLGSEGFSCTFIGLRL